jgi:hypothetical protein
MNVHKTFGLGVQRQSLITKTTGSSDRKDKCPFSHYGWLLVDWYCQNGIPLQGVFDLRSRLIGPHAVTGLVVKERRQKKMKENPAKFLCLPGGDHIAMKDRQLDTWFANAMVTEFLVDCKVRCHIPTVLL